MKVLRNILSWVVPIVVAVVIVLLVRTYLFEVVKVSGGSMDPNLTTNERMVVIKPLKLKRLSVIVFDAYGEDPAAAPNTNYVKRVIGLPGDKVVSKNGYIYVNNQKINQPFISQASLAKKNHWTYRGNTVPQGHYFVLGDHRSISEDSRAWGYVDANKVMGVVKVPFWTGTRQHRTNINTMAS